MNTGRIPPLFIPSSHKPTALDIATAAFLRPRIYGGNVQAQAAAARTIRALTPAPPPAPWWAKKTLGGGRP